MTYKIRTEEKQLVLEHDGRDIMRADTWLPVDSVKENKNAIR